MRNIALGFLPSHRDPFSEEWAVSMRDRCLKAMSDIPGVEWVVPSPDLTERGLVRDDQDAEKAVDLFAESDIDGLVIGTMTFGDEVSCAEVASQMGVPTLLFGTKEGPFTEDGNRLSDSFCGTLSVASALRRRGISSAFLDILFPEEEVFSEGLQEFARTCSGVSGFMGARVGMVGTRPERFETCSFSEAPLIEQFDQRVVQLSMADLFDGAGRIEDDDEDVLRIMDELEGGPYQVKMDRENLLKSARLEVALLRWADEKDLSCMAVQCWSAMQDVYGVASCLCMGRLTARGLMTACEVDVLGALSMLLQYEAAMEATVPHFIDWTIQHQEHENRFYAWHCGNAPLCLAAEPEKVQIGTHSILDRVADPAKCQGVAEFQLTPGPVSLNRLIEEDGDFKLLITNGVIVQDDATRRGSWSWVEVPDLKYLYRTLVEEGFIHHASMIHGDLSNALEGVCHHLDIDPVLV